MKYFLIALLFLLSLGYSGYYLYMYDKKKDKTEKIERKDSVRQNINTVQIPDYLDKTFWKTVTFEELKEKLKNIKNINEIHPTNKMNMLQLLVIYGQDLRMIDLLISSGIDDKFRSKSRGTAFHYAVIREKGAYEWTKELFNYNYDINIKGGRTDASPLVWAVHARAPLELIKFLLEKGANPNFQTTERGTALKAVSVPNKEKNIFSIDPKMVQLLLDYKADITIKDLKRKTAFDYMKENEEFTKIELFKKLSSQVK